MPSNESKISLGNGKLTISTNIPMENVKNAIKKYISYYVECCQCKNLNTELLKELRVYMIKCLSCNSVLPVKNKY